MLRNCFYDGRFSKFKDIMPRPRSSTYGSNSPLCTFASSFVQASTCGTELGMLNVYGTSCSSKLICRLGIIQDSCVHFFNEHFLLIMPEYPQSTFKGDSDL